MKEGTLKKRRPATYTPKSRIITIRVSHEFGRKLDRASRRKKSNLSDCIREAMSLFLIQQ